MGWNISFITMNRVAGASALIAGIQQLALWLVGSMTITSVLFSDPIALRLSSRFWPARAIQVFHFSIAQSGGGDRCCSVGSNRTAPVILLQ